MHRGEDYDHPGHGAGYGGLGHNRPRTPSQWQTPHRADSIPEAPSNERDIDLVEVAFVESFINASDPTSFLRLSGVPFEIAAAGGVKLKLLRIEIDAITDVGSVTPHVGGASFRYDPLPAGLVSHRRRLGFIYFDGRGLRRLSFAEVRGDLAQAACI